MKQELYGIVRKDNKYFVILQERDGTQCRPFGGWDSKDVVKAYFQKINCELQDWTEEGPQGERK